LFALYNLPTIAFSIQQLKNSASSNKKSRKMNFTLPKTLDINVNELNSGSTYLGEEGVGGGKNVFGR
jgi:hypothetical protein